jgi:dTDP-4-amino-4,6-dideoxy-D-galactose acyltransferase
MMIEADPWLAGILGFNVFRIALPTETEISPKTISRALLERSQGSSAFFYAKIPTTDVSTATALCSIGFYVVEANLTLEREPEPASASAGDRMIEVREAESLHQEAILEIANTCFVYSRFHLDPRIPNTAANAIKRAWIHSYVQKQRGEQLLAAEMEGSPAGFLAILRAEMQSGSRRIIDLMGVARAAQGRGVGKRLVDFFVSDSLGKCAKLRVGTQVSNTESIRLYERCGFRIIASAYVLHAHIRNGQIQR